MDRRAIWVAVVVVASACEPSPPPTAQTTATATASLQTHAPFSEQPDFPDRLHSTIQAALDYWGGTWDDLRGSRILFTDSPTVSCYGREALGCYDGDIRLTTQDPALGTFSCVEQTVLVHEIGHAVIGDPNHEDPRWMEMNSLAGQLSGRTGYTADGDVPCVIYVSVWRHPIGSP
jgi:hypothetical protein